MQRHYKEKALLATKYKIERLEKESGFFRKNFINIALCGMLFALWAPTYSDSQGRTIMQRLEMSYWHSVIAVSIFFLIFCLLGHFVWSFQEKNQMKRLKQRKVEIEEELKQMKK